MLESVFLAIAAVFSAFGLFCFVKLWFSDLGNDAYSAIFLESGDDSEILDMKIREAGRSWLYGRSGIVILIPESRNYDRSIADYIKNKGLKAIYYKEQLWQK